MSGVALLPGDQTMSSSLLVVPVAAKRLIVVRLNVAGLEVLQRHVSVHVGRSSEK